MKNMRALILLIVVVLGLGAIAYKTLLPKSSVNKPQNKIKVVASFYPLADFAKNVGGDLVDVTNITPGGVEPHDYEPTPLDLVKAQSANIFIFNGNGVDAWAEKIQAELKNKGVSVLEMSKYVDSTKITSEESEGNSYDPHFWLDPINAQKEVDTISDILIKADPKNIAVYSKNRDSFKSKLEELDKKYKTGLSSCKLNEIVVSHNAFNYLAKRYNLTTLYISGISPDEEPSPKRIAEIADLAKAKNIKYIFFETLVSQKLSETVASEIDAKTLVLNPIEGLTDDEIASGKNYLSIMEENLSNLRIALECK